MISFFDKKTVYEGTSIKEFNSVRNILELNHIKYDYKTIDLQHNSWLGRNGVTRSMGGNWGKIDSLIYEIVVHKKDYEYALRVISRKKL